MKREDTRLHGAVVPRAVAAAAGSQQERVEHYPRRSAPAIRALPASEPSCRPSRSVAIPAEALQLLAVFAAATCSPSHTAPLRSWPREAPGSLPRRRLQSGLGLRLRLVTHENAALVVSFEPRACSAAGIFARGRPQCALQVQSAPSMHTQAPNPSIEGTFQRPLRALWPAPHVKR